MKTIFLYLCVFLTLFPGCYRKVNRHEDPQGGIDEMPIRVVGGQGGEISVVGGAGGELNLAGSMAGTSMDGGAQITTGGDLGEGGTAGTNEPHGGFDQSMGGQSAGGQGTGGQSAGGEGEPEQNLRYAPQVWRPDQTKLDLTACGDVPLSNLEFEPVYHEGFDEVDPVTNEPIASHWYAQVQGSRVNHTRGSNEHTHIPNDFAFAWTAPEDGNYTFHGDYNFRRGALPPLLFIRDECDRPDSEILLLYGNGQVWGNGRQFTRESPTIFMEAGQTVFVFMDLSYPSSHLTIHVYRSNGQTAPTVVEAQARRDVHTRRIDVFFKAFDPNQDIRDAEFELLEAQGGEAIPTFLNGDQTWIPFLATYTFDHELPDDLNYLRYSFNLREANGLAYVYPPHSFVNEPTHLRFRIRDVEGNESNIIDIEIEEGSPGEEIYEGESILGQPCLFDGQCSTGLCKEVDGNRQCVEPNDLRIQTVTAYQTDQQIRLRMVAEDPSNSLVSFETGFVEDEVEIVGKGFSFWGPNLVTEYDFSSAGQELFELGTSIPWINEDENPMDRLVRMYPKSLYYRLDTSRFIDGLDDPWLDTAIEPMPLAELGEDCDPHQYQNVCVYGTACMEQVGGNSICEEASVPVVTSVRAVWNERLERLSLDLEGEGDVLGYRLSGFNRIEPEDVYVLGHTEINNGRFQSQAEYRFIESVGFFSFEDETWIEVINRQGYSSLPFRFEVERIEGEDPCALIDCLEGFICEDHPWILGEARCVEVPAPFPDPPTLESLTVRFDSEKTMAWVEGTGRTNVEGEAYNLSLQLEDENGEQIGSIRYGFEDQDNDPMRFSFSEYKRIIFEVDPVAMIGASARVSHVPPYVESFASLNYGELFDGVFEVIPAQQMGEVCDPRGYESSCVRGSSCIEAGVDEARCVDDTNGCLSNRLNAHLNAWETPDDTSPIRVRWETLPLASAFQYEPRRILNGTYENKCDQGSVYSFTAPSDGIYRFAVRDWLTRRGSTYHDGFHLGLSTLCNAPAANLQCETRLDKTLFRYSNRDISVENFPEYGEEICADKKFNQGYVYQAALYEILGAGQTVYLYVNQILDPLYAVFGMYSVSVDAYHLAPALRALGEDSQTKATFDSENRKAVIQVEVSDLGSSLDLVRTMLEYQPLDAANNPIALATLGGDVDAEERWLIPLRQLPRTPEPKDGEPFAANTSAFTPPVAEDRLDDIAAFRVWLLTDEGLRSEPVDIQISVPELVQEERDCDPYGFYNRCSEGLVCMDLSSPNQCSDHPEYDRFAEEFGCYEPTEQCPEDACPADWSTRNLSEGMPPEGPWIHGDALIIEDPDGIAFDLRSYCGDSFDRHHVFAFTATEAGRYRAHLSSDTVESDSSRFRLSVRDACTRAETDLGCSLENSYADPDDREFSRRLYRRQYFDEPFLVQPVRTNTDIETIMDLHENQTIYFFVSTLGFFLEDEENIPYELMLEKL